MNREDDRQLSLDLGAPAVKKSGRVDEKSDDPTRRDADIRSLSEIRSSRQKEESAKHFREIIKRARHF